MYMSFCWNEYAKKSKIVALSPMDGYTDSAFRQISKIIEPNCVVFSEFVSADGFSKVGTKLKHLIDFNANIERPYIVQLFGKHPEKFAEAAKIIEQFGVDGIDINFGCPAKKVVGSGHGSDLIRHPSLAAEIVYQTQKAISIPVSTKTRLGWTDDSTLQSFIEGLVNAGSKMITIHGRTVKQAFMGNANWDPIYKLKEKFPNSVILGNGDITSGEVAKEKIKNLSGVMIGRASFGNMWILKEVRSAFENKNYNPPNINEKKDIILKYAEILIQTKGEKRAMLEFRKHLLNFTKGFEGAKELRRNMTSINNIENVKNVISCF